MRQYTYYDETRQGFVKSNSPAEDKDLLKKFNSGSLMEDFFLHIRSLDIDKKWFGPRKAFVDGQQVNDYEYEDAYQIFGIEWAWANKSTYLEYNGKKRTVAVPAQKAKVQNTQEEMWDELIAFMREAFHPQTEMKERIKLLKEVKNIFALQRV